MAYERIDWENEPSVNTPINKDNLNHMEDGIVQNETDIAGKMDANNPTGTGAVSVNRLSGSVVGHESVAMGNDCSATMAHGVAMGSRAVASGVSAIAMGQGSVARANYSHSFGRISVAEGEDSVVFGYATNAKSDNQFVEGKYNEVDTDGTYAHIVGGGTGEDDRRNIQTLDWEGNETIAGDYTNGNGETLHGAYQAFIDALPVDSESGNPCVITDAFNTNAKSVKLTLEPIQSGSGTPSPTNVRPISGRTQSTATRSGKNFYSKTPVYVRNGCTQSNYSTAKSDVTFTAASGFFGNSAQGTFTDQDPTRLVTVEPQKTYTVSLHALSNAPAGISLKCYVQFYDKEGKNASSWIMATGSELTFTVPSGKYKMGFNCNFTDTTIGATMTIGFQLEGGDTATDWEAYNGESITRTYGQTIYGGSDDVTGDGATVTKGLYIPSVTSVGYSASAGCNYADCHGITIVENSDTICNMYDQIPYGNTGAEGKYKIYPSAVTIYDSRFTDVATAQAVLNDCQIVYPLYTPTSIPLTAQNVTLLHGDNVLTTDADSVEASYSADIALYIAKKIAEGISQGNRSLSKGGSSESTEEVKKNETPKESEEIKEETKEEIKEEVKEEVKEEK